MRIQRKKFTSSVSTEKRTLPRLKSFKGRFQKRKLRQSENLKQTIERKISASFNSKPSDLKMIWENSSPDFLTKYSPLILTLANCSKLRTALLSFDLQKCLFGDAIANQVFELSKRTGELIMRLIESGAFLIGQEYYLERGGELYEVFPESTYLFAEELTPFEVALRFAIQIAEEILKIHEIINSRRTGNQTRTNVQAILEDVQNLIPPSQLLVNAWAEITNPTPLQKIIMDFIQVAVSDLKSFFDQHQHEMERGIQIQKKGRGVPTKRIYNPEDLKFLYNRIFFIGQIHLIICQNLLAFFKN